MKDLHYIFGEIVDGMRNTGIISSVEVSGNNYIYYAANDFKKLDYVTLFDISGEVINANAKIIDADSDSFILSENYAATSYKANAPYFIDEEWVKASNILAEKTKQDTFKYQKYPLVLLVRPFSIANSVFDYSVPSVRVAFINHTYKNIYSDERFEENFNPILTPLFNQFVDGMMQHKNLLIANPNKLELSELDQFDMDANPLPDELDAKIVDLSNLTIANTENCLINISNYV